jgi:hypothetical protein
MSKLRLSLTIPGAVSLGAYEGGALAALILAARTLGEENVLIDTIASASAGSITALLTARALLRGCSPTDLLSAAWVESASLAKMKTRSTQSPLSSKALQAMASDLLAPNGIKDGPPEVPRQGHSITISMALASLAGLTYSLASLSSSTAVAASTYLDFYNVTLTKDDDANVYVRYASGAIASGSNAMGFPPLRLNRKSEEQNYVDAGLEGFPADGEFWYTDGGTVDNEPLGRSIDLAGAIPSGDERLHLLIHPDPGAPSSHMTEVFGGDAPTPPWVRTATHVVSMMQAQSIYDDLRTLEKTNSRLAWVRTIGPALRDGLEQGLLSSGLPADKRDEIRDRVTTSLSEALAEVRSQQRVIEETSKRAPNPRSDAGGMDYAATLGALVEAASGLEGRDPVKVEIVSPALGAGPGQSPSSLLAGAFLFHFGGFIDIEFRKSDFALGFRNMTYWLENGLAAHLPGVDLGPALSAVGRAYDELGWDGIRHGGATLNSLRFSQKLGLLRLGGHVAHVVEHDVLRSGAGEAPAP